MNSLKKKSMKVSHSLCDIGEIFLPPVLKDLREKNILLKEMDNFVTDFKTNITVSNYVNRFHKIGFNFDTIADDVLSAYDPLSQTFNFKHLTSEGFSYVRLVNEYLTGVKKLSTVVGYNDVTKINDKFIYDIVKKIKESSYKKPNKKDLFNGIEIGNPFLINKGLFGGYDGWLLKDMNEMFDNVNGNNLFGQHLSYLQRSKPETFNSLKNNYKLVADEKGALARSITSAKSFSGALFRFMNYTVNYMSGLALGVVQAISYENLKVPFRGVNMNKVHNIRTSLGILPDNSLLNINQLLADAHSSDSFGFLLHNTLDKLTSFLDKYPKVKEYVMQTSGGLHNVIDLVYDNSLRNIGFLRALKENGISGIDELMKLKKTLSTDEYKDLIGLIKKDTYSYYEDMRGFPINYGLNKVYGKFWGTMNYVFGFMSSWGLNVMKTALNDTTIPIRSGLKYYGETGDLSGAIKLFMKGFTSERFLYSLMTISHAGLMGHRISRAAGDEQDENSKIGFVKKTLSMSQYFNQSLQAFESNIFGRVYMEGINGLTYKTGPEGDATTFALFKGMSELTNSFFRELRSVEPFIAGINSYQQALKSGASSNEAETIAYNSIFRAIKKGMGGYIRYLQPTQSSMDDYYRQHVSDSDSLSFILGENVNRQKNAYYDLKDYESYLHLFKGSNKSANIVNYIIWNMPILKGAIKDDYYNYMGNFGGLVKTLTSDNNLWKIRSTGVIPVSLDGASDLQQEQWVNSLYNDLTKRAPKKYNNIKGVNENLIFSSAEMKRVFKSAYKSLPEIQENIWTRKMLDTLKNKGAYETYLKLYHQHDGRADENAYRGMVQIMGMINAESPGSARKLLSSMAYGAMSGLAKERYHVSYSQLTPIEMLDLKREVLKRFVPLMNFRSDKGYIDYSFQTNAIQSYLKIMKPDLFKTLASGGGDKSKSNYLNKGVMEYITLDTYTMNNLLSGDIDAYKIKNLFTKVGNSLQNDDLKMFMVNKTLETIDKFKLDLDDKKAVETGILLGNQDILDKIIKDKSFREKYGTLADGLIKRLRAVHKHANNSKEEDIKAKNFQDAANKTGHKINNPYHNKKANKYKDLNTKLNNYVKKNYGAVSKIGRNNNGSGSYPSMRGTQYSPSFGANNFRKPYSMRLAPAYAGGHRAVAKSKPFKHITGAEQKGIRRTFNVKEGKIKPIKLNTK